MNPLVIYALLTAASMGANAAAQKKVDHGRAAAMRDAEERRKASEKRAADSAKSTTQLFTQAAGDEDTKAADIEAAYLAHERSPAADAVGATGLPPTQDATLTVEGDNSIAGRARAKQHAIAHAQSKLGSFGEVMSAAQIAAGRNSEDIAREQSAVRNWNANVLPARLAQANASGKDLSTVADLFQLAAMLYGPKALTKVPVAGAEAGSVGAGAGIGQASVYGGGGGVFDVLGRTIH